MRCILRKKAILLFRFEKDTVRKDPRGQKSGIRKHITEPKAGELDDSVVVQDDGLARQHRLTIHHHSSHALTENKYFNIVSKEKITLTY